MLSIFGLHINLDWFYIPDDHEVIRRWTKPSSGGWRRHELTIEESTPANGPWSFLVLGDTGDSDRFGTLVSPQEAIAALMAQDCQLGSDALPGAPPLASPARIVLHTGDVNYLTGEERLYDRNFIDPYRAFQTSESHFQNLVFRIPFLPVPGNHDYYDLHGWVSKIMSFGSWVGLSRVLTHFFYRLGLSVPLGGSGRGAAYMRAFVEDADEVPQPLPYKPGVHTQLPNRYYQFRRGNVHFFALDSNTLDAPPPGAMDPFKENAVAIAERAEKKLAHLNEQVERDRQWEEEETTRQRTAMKVGEREELWPRLQQLLGDVAAASEALPAATLRWAQVVATGQSDDAKQLEALAQAERDLHDRWAAIVATVKQAPQSVVAYEAQLDELIKLQEEWLQHLASRDKLTVLLPGAPEYEAARAARSALDAALGSWCRERMGESLPGPCADPAGDEDTDGENAPPETVSDTEKADLGETILDTQRDLALARKLKERKDEDYDEEQIAWLRAGLDALKAEEAKRRETEPEFILWRIVFMHHPLYTTMPSHTERADSVDVRRNLQEILLDADLVLAGHSHGFEWLHSSTAPNVCFVVTGAGGMSRLQGSVFSSHLAGRFAPAIESITSAGLDSLVWASGDPSSSGSTVEHKLFSYLRVHVDANELRIEPTGARQTVDTPDGVGEWERVQPLPVHEVPNAAQWRSGAGETRERFLDHIVIRRNEPPRAVWRE